MGTLCSLGGDLAVEEDEMVEVGCLFVKVTMDDVTGASLLLGSAADSGCPGVGWPGPGVLGKVRYGRALAVGGCRS